MTRTSLALAAVAVTAAACGGPSQEPASQDAAAPEPQPTVTVTETVTADAAESDATPAPDDDAGADVCADEAALAEQAFIFVTAPAPGTAVDNPFTVRGCANTFEANLQWRLVGRDGNAITEGHATASCGTGCVGTFEFDVRYPQEEPRIATLEVYETSAEDGSVELLNAIPVRLGSSS